MKQSLTFLFLLIGVKMFAQFGCPPGTPGAAFCFSSCVFCDFESGVTDFTSAPTGTTWTINPCQTGAGPITLENPQWYAFVAGSFYAEFAIKIEQCQDLAAGLDAAIVINCNYFPPLNPYIAISCATIDAANPTISVLGLNPGQVYYLVVDGVNGNVCKYTITPTPGSTTPPQLGAIGEITGPTEVCPKAMATYTIPNVNFAVNYTWTAPPGSKINGTNNNTVTLPANVFGSNTVTVEFGTQGGNVCFTATSPCDTPLTACLQVVNQAIPITDLPDRILCFQELPFFWEEAPNTPIVGPGNYTLVSAPYDSYLGCDSIVRQKFKVLPNNIKQLPTKYLCEPECFIINGFEYCETGSYQEYLISENGCDSLVLFSVVKVPVKAVIQSADTITCEKTSVVLTSVGSTPGSPPPSVSYNWLNPGGQSISMSDTAVATASGTYTLIVTNVGGGMICRDTATVNVVASTTVPLANAGPPQVLSCAVPQIQLQGSGSMGPQYSYLWIASNGGNIMSGSATLTPTVNATGTYTLQVKNNNNGCISTSVTSVTALNLPPTVSVNGGTYTCSQPSVTLQSTTNATSPTYSWSGPNGFVSMLPNPTANVAGNYTLIVTDSISGCTNTAVATVIDNTQPPGATASGDTLTCAVTSVVLNGGSPAMNPSFVWTGPGGFTSMMQNPTTSTPGVYQLTVTGENGCTSTASATVSQDDDVPGASLSALGNLNCNNASINIVATSTPPPSQLTHTWTLPDNTTTSTGTNPVLNVNQPGVYSVVITDNENGCTSTSTVTVVQSPSVTATASSTGASCFGDNDGSVSVTAGGGNGTFTYLWNIGGNMTATVNNLGSGTYTVTVTDGENCTATATAVVGQPEPIMLTATATPQTANGAADGTATASPAGGTPGYTYEWSNGGMTATITDLLPGSYTVTVTDNNNCTAVAVVTVNAFNCTIQATGSFENVTCAGANDGSATITVSNAVDPVSYMWSNGGMTSTVTDLAPGTYTGVATDAANCPTELLFTITEPDPLSANASATNATGPGTNDGTATAAPNGGTAPYTYEWSNGGMTATITGLEAGIYTVIVTDANDCTATQSVEVLAGNCGLTSSFLTINPSCNGLSNGEATVLLTGGNGPFTYEWSSDGTGATETNLSAGTYTVTVTDVNDCEITDEVTLTDPPALTIALDTVVNTSCVNAPLGSATVLAAGGTGVISVNWDNGQTGFTAINLTAGTYTAVATDANGCSISVSATVDAVDQEAPVIVANPVDVALGQTGDVTLTPQLLNLNVSDNCTVSEITLVPTTFNCTNLGPQTIVVTATDDSGNSSTATVTATIVDNLPPTITCPSSITRCFGDNVVQYAAPVATDNCLGNGGMFDFTGLPSGANFPEGVTTNTYTYTDAGGNAGSCSFEVTILSQITTTAAITNDVDNQNIGAIDLTVSGGLAPYTFSWTKDGAPFPPTTEDLENLGMGQYTVVVTDAFGCTVQSQSFTVTSMVDANEPSWASELLIRPNPTAGHVFIIFPDGLNEEVQITVLDVTGRQVQQRIVQSPKQVDLDFSVLPDGVYPVLLRIQNQTIARRIVVSK